MGTKTVNPSATNEIGTSVSVSYNNVVAQAGIQAQQGTQSAASQSGTDISASISTKSAGRLTVNVDVVEYNRREVIREFQRSIGHSR